MSALKKWPCGCFGGCSEVCLGETQALMNGTAERELVLILVLLVVFLVLDAWNWA